VAVSTPEEVYMAFDRHGFSDFMARCKAASKALNMALELPAATWEPHDWSDFA
jgi:hypothetical protein